MKNFASGNGRCEFGFYIYYNKNTNTYSYGEIVQGTIIQGYKEKNANVSLGKVIDNTTVCAFFYCHTTLRYYPKETMRRTGPSSADKSFACGAFISKLTETISLKLPALSFPCAFIVCLPSV